MWEKKTLDKWLNLNLLAWSSALSMYTGKSDQVFHGLYLVFKDLKLYFDHGATTCMMSENDASGLNFIPWGPKGGWRVETISPHTCSSRPKNLYKKDFKVVFTNKRNLNLPVTYFRDDSIPHNRSFSVKTSHCSEKSWFWHKSHCMILMFQYSPAVMRDKFEITISADIINRVESVHLMTLSDFFCSVKNIKNRIQDACISFPKKNWKPEDHHSPS